MKEFKVLSPTAILGYGFPEDSFIRGMEMKPDAIAVDAGSTDPGPYYLGSGVSFTDRIAVKRDLAYMIEGGLSAGIPVLVGTAGGSGARPHVDWTVDIVKEIANEKTLNFKLAVIYSDFSKEVILQAYEKGNLTPLYPAKEAVKEDIEQSTYIVGQMGVEPFIEALESGAQVIIAGRSYDPSMFAAPAILNGFDEGLSLHMGKILECACIAATPGSGSDCMLGIVGEDYFDVYPLNPERRCTITSVAAHTLYEKTNPYILPGPGGRLELEECNFKENGDGSVRVRGSKYVPEKMKTVKIEAAMANGYRTISIAGTRDKLMISRIEEITDEVKAIVKKSFNNIDYSLQFKFYGKNAIMGRMEKNMNLPHELGLLIDVVSGTQEWANAVCSLTRSTFLHYGYEGRISTAGNLAFPYSPSDIKVGKIYRFSLYHLIKEVDFKRIFCVTFEKVGNHEV